MVDAHGSLAPLTSSSEDGFILAYLLFPRAWPGAGNRW